MGPPVLDESDVLHLLLLLLVLGLQVHAQSAAADGLPARVGLVEAPPLLVAPELRAAATLAAFLPLLSLGGTTLAVLGEGVDVAPHLLHHQVIPVLHPADGRPAQEELQTVLLIRSVFHFYEEESLPMLCICCSFDIILEVMYACMLEICSMAEADAARRSVGVPDLRYHIRP